MKTKIKNLRVRIDGLAQLTKQLNSNGFIIEHPMMVPEDFNVEDINKTFNNAKKGIIITEASEPKLTQIKSNKELDQATCSLLLVKAWLGKMLELLGSETPYTNDGNRKTVEDIEPTADVAFPIKMIEYNSGKKEFEGLNHIEKVDWLREQIKDIIDNTEDFSKEHDHIELEQGFVYKHLSEARFWLGFELQRIKEKLQ